MKIAEPSRRLRIAFLGTRGVPARYSGFETFVEELGTRLAARGHEVTVYSRRHLARGHSPTRSPPRSSELQPVRPHDRGAVSAYPDTYRSMRQVWVRGIPTKHLGTISHTFISCLHALFHPYDVVVMCIAGNSPLAWLPRLRGTQVILNVDGSDWRRKKWGRLARTYIRASERLAIHTPSAIVTDNRVMHQHYLDRFGVDTECIPYGGDLPAAEGTTTLREYGLRSRNYLLLVGRLVPDNCIDHLVDAFERLRPDLECVVVGDAPYEERYIADLKRRGPHVTFTGYLFGEGCRELMQNAYAFVFCSEVGGTHPVLLEAMAAGNCVVVNDTPANLEVIGDTGIPYNGALGAEGLLPVLRSILDDEVSVADYRQRARHRARTHYSWESVTDRYEELFRRLVENQVRDSAKQEAGTGR